MEKRRCKPFLTRCPLRGRNCCRPLNAGHISSSDTLHDEEPVVRSSAYFYTLDCQFLAWGSRAQQLFGFSPPDVLGRYCYDVLPARDASGQCLCSVNCPMVVAARYGYSVPPSEACIWTKQNGAIWVRLSPIVLRAPHGAIC